MHLQPDAPRRGVLGSPHVPGRDRPGDGRKARGSAPIAETGDGKTRSSAIPIGTPRVNDELRAAIGRIFEDSLWEINKTVYARLGAMLGDVVLYAVLDVPNKRSYLEVIHPESLVEYECDPVGIPQMYAIEEEVDDPEPQTEFVEKVIRREEGWLVRNNQGEPIGCEFRTYLIRHLEPEPWDWYGTGSSWTEPYPFVPMVLVPHMKIMPSVPFGQAEYTPVAPKLRELVRMKASVE